MQRYFARSKEAQERLVKAAKGIKDKPEIPAPTDELDFVLLNIQSDPALLHGRGAVPLKVLSEQQKRERQRAALDAHAAESRKALDGFIKGDDDESAAFNFNAYEGLSDAEADAVIENDPDDDPYGVFDDLNLGQEDN